MKLKYFLRGVGIGLIVTTIILSITNNKGEMTDEEIIQRAKELGYEQETIFPIASLPQPTALQTQEETTEAIAAETVTTEAPTKETATTEAPTDEAVITEPATIEIVTTEQVITEAETTETETTEPAIKDAHSFVINIIGGMSSNRVAQILYENGIIDNAVAFDNYLIENGYANIIRIGTFEVNKSMTYEEIARKISNR